MSDERKKQIEWLKQVYGAQTEQQVIERALRLALEASKYARDGGSGGGGDQTEVQKLMADREPGDMPSPQDFRTAFDADARRSR